MITSNASFRQPQTIACATLASLALVLCTVPPAAADFLDPCGKYKTGSKQWKKCKRSNLLPGPDATDDERFIAGYWLAKQGRYKAALHVLASVEKRDDPRVWNYIGYATRKLGHVDEALSYYKKALALAPDYVMSRAYLGEAYLFKGNLAAAREQLMEIASRCGTNCAAYLSLEKKLRDAGA